MFSFSLTEQVILFFESIGVGVLLAMLYNVIDIVISIFTVQKKKTVICDILWCLSATIAFFCFTLAYNFGTFRFYSILGTLFGLSAYFVAFGLYAQNFFEKVANIPRWILNAIFREIKEIILIFFKRLACTFNNKRKKEKEPKKEKKKSKKPKKTIANRNKDVV